MGGVAHCQHLVLVLVLGLGMNLDLVLGLDLGLGLGRCRCRGFSNGSAAVCSQRNCFICPLKCTGRKCKHFIGFFVTPMLHVSCPLPHATYRYATCPICQHCGCLPRLHICFPCSQSLIVNVCWLVSRCLSPSFSYSLYLSLSLCVPINSTSHCLCKVCHRLKLKVRCFK